MNQNIFKIMTVVGTFFITSLTTKSEIILEKIEDKNKQIIETIQDKQVVYDDLTKEELVMKFDKIFNSDLDGYEEVFIDHALELGVDPYLALAITLEETGCKWECSTLVKKCNNIGGQKGNPGCNGGSYKSYNTMEEGIYGFLNNLSKNYFKKGLNTPELINTKYAESKNWSMKINNYVDYIKNIDKKN